MPTTWEESLKAYLDHDGVNIYAIREEVDDATRIINSLPDKVKQAVIAELNKWGRDDFVEFSGYLSALETVSKNLDRKV